MPGRRSGTGYARIDFMVPGAPDGAGGWRIEPDAEPVMLEANTLPGFTPRSLPLAAETEGVGFPRTLRGAHRARARSA